MDDPPAGAIGATPSIRFITAAETYPLRLAVLRPGQPPESAVFPGDEQENSFHLGFFKEEKLISIASFIQNKHPYFRKALQYQLRGMASDPEFRGSGAGRSLVAFALDHLLKKRGSLLWCNARRDALPFYRKCGFKEKGNFFEVPGIGMHKVMYVRPHGG